MNMKYYVVDAFTDKLFKGNPAGVCLLEEWLDDELLQNIAAENNLAETAFVVKQKDYYDLRWFTPTLEIDLCGHATLASAFIVSNFLDKGKTKMDFHTKSGVLPVQKFDDLYELNFPSRMPTKIDDIPEMEQALGVPILEAHQSRDLLLLLKDEEQIINLKPDINLLAKLPDAFAVIVTAKGDSADFVSRFFAPNAGINEDPVTGSTHTSLIPFWSKKLGKDKMVARQLSERGGIIYCRNAKERVFIAGRASLCLLGDINI
jgi:PhzF family phenazine biosynthesis protein